MRYGIVCDVDKCCGCHSCFVACKDEYVGNETPNSAPQGEDQSWIRLKELESGSGWKVEVDYIPILCQHCENPVCAIGAPEGMVWRRPDGIVILDPVKAKGHREMVSKCPYGCIFYNEVLDVPQKCTMCAHMLDQGEMTTRCVEVCPVGALVFGDLDDPNSEISKLVQEKGGQLETFHPEWNSHPTVKYLNLPKPFFAGEIACEDKEECIEGAKVTLTGANGYFAQTATDAFGDFAFHGLKQNEEYTVHAELEGYQPCDCTARAFSSKNLGVLTLRKR